MGKSTLSSGAGGRQTARSAWREDCVARRKEEATRRKENFAAVKWHRDTNYNTFSADAQTGSSGRKCDEDNPLCLYGLSLGIPAFLFMIIFLIGNSPAVRRHTERIREQQFREQQQEYASNLKKSWQRMKKMDILYSPEERLELQ